MSNWSFRGPFTNYQLLITSHQLPATCLLVTHPRFTLSPSSGTFKSGNPIDRRPRLRLAIYPAHRAPHPRTKRILRRSPVHGLAERDQELRARRHHSVRRPFIGL